jgi:hypothetical protein
MKKLTIVLSCTVLLLVNLLKAEDLELKEVVRPDVFILSQNFAYIGEKHQVYIYSLPGYKFIQKFGKAGEGPGEFKLGHGINNLTINVIGDKLVIGSIGKLYVYSLKGELLQEHKVPSMQRFLPAGDGFVSNTSLKGKEGNQVQGVALFNKDLSSKTVLMKSDIPVGMGVKMYIPKPNFKYIVYRNKIYLSESLDKINIGIIDFQGRKLGDISGQFEPLQISKLYKKNLTHYYKTDPNWKNFWNYMKKFLTFPENFPAVRDFFIDEDLIYVQTFLVEDNKTKWKIFDLKGKCKGEALLPIVNLYTDQLPLHAVKQAVYFYLQEEIDGDNWLVKQSEINLKKKE